MFYIERLPFNHDEDDLKTAVGLSSSDDIKIPEDPKEVPLSKLLRLTATAVYISLESAAGNSPTAGLLLQALSVPGNDLKASQLVERVEELILRLAETLRDIFVRTQPDTPDNKLLPLSIVTAAALILENTVNIPREGLNTSHVPLTAVN